MVKKIEKINENKVSLKLFGYDKYFNDFFNLYDKSKFPKVSLLSGDKGLGKYTFIFHLINCFLFTINVFRQSKREKFDRHKINIFKLFFLKKKP